MIPLNRPAEDSAPPERKPAGRRGCLASDQQQPRRNGRQGPAQDASGGLRGEPRSQHEMDGHQDLRPHMQQQGQSAKSVDDAERTRYCVHGVSGHQSGPGADRQQLTGPGPPGKPGGDGSARRARSGR